MLFEENVEFVNYRKSKNTYIIYGGNKSGNALGELQKKE